MIVRASKDGIETMSNQNSVKIIQTEEPSKLQRANTFGSRNSLNSGADNDDIKALN
jgi:hypothetical protein